MFAYQASYSSGRLFGYRSQPINQGNNASWTANHPKVTIDLHSLHSSQYLWVPFNAPRGHVNFPPFHPPSAPKIPHRNAFPPPKQRNGALLWKEEGSHCCSRRRSFPYSTGWGWGVRWGVGGWVNGIGFCRVFRRFLMVFVGIFFWGVHLPKICGVLLGKIPCLTGFWRLEVFGGPNLFWDAFSGDVGELLPEKHQRDHTLYYSMAVLYKFEYSINLKVIKNTHSNVPANKNWSAVTFHDNSSCPKCSSWTWGPFQKKTNVQVPSKTPHSIVRSAVGRIWSSNHHFFRCLNHFWRYIFAMKIMNSSCPMQSCEAWPNDTIAYIWRKKPSILFPYSRGKS